MDHDTIRVTHGGCTMWTAPQTGCRVATQYHYNTILYIYIFDRGGLSCSSDPVVQ